MEWNGICLLFGKYLNISNAIKHLHLCVQKHRKDIAYRNHILQEGRLVHSDLPQTLQFVHSKQCFLVSLLFDFEMFALHLSVEHKHTSGISRPLFVSSSVYSLNSGRIIKAAGWRNVFLSTTSLMCNRGVNGRIV